jgi:ribokinase
VRDPEHATGVAPIWVDDRGENSIVVVLGANLAVSRADVDKAAAVIAQADVLIAQLEIEYDTVAYALKTAREKGIPTILNPAPVGKVPPELIALADYLTPNEIELETLSGISGNVVEPAARALLTSERQTAVVTLGEQGADWIRGDISAHVPAFKVNVVDTTGAGDAFNGGFAVALGEGKNLEDAVYFANATAGLSVTRPGTASSMPHREEVEALLRSQR